MAAATVAAALACSQPDRQPPPANGELPADRVEEHSEEPVWREPTATLDEALATKRVAQDTLVELEDAGRAPVIVRLSLGEEFRSEGNLPGEAAKRQRTAIAAAQSELLARLAATLDEPRIAPLRRYASVPYVALTVDKELLSLLVRLPEVRRVLHDRERELHLDRSVPQIGGDLVHRSARSYSPQIPPVAARQTIAVLDTGVEASHPFLTGLLGSKVVSEACFVAKGPGCPGGGNSAIGPGTGAPCALAQCDHGTHVAGIAAGSTAGFRGVAPSSNIIAMQVFHETKRRVLVNPPECGEEGDGETREVTVARVSDSSTLAALERVLALSATFQIAAVNMSYGHGAFTNVADCIDDCFAYRDIVANLNDAGIAVVSSAGNGARTCNPATGNLDFVPGVDAPACLPEVIAVGSVGDTDGVSRFSQGGALLDLFAPGEGINSSVLGGNYDRFSGTSMAAPHVAGAIAVLKNIDPWRDVADIKGRLAATGVSVTDARDTTPVVVPRIQVDAALEAQLGAPLAPSDVTVVAISGTAIRIAWTDNSASEASFRATAAPVSSTVPVASRTAVTAADVTEEVIQLLEPDTEYELFVRACWSGGQCSERSKPDVTRRTADTLPRTPTNFRAGDVGPNHIEVLWDSSSANPVDEFRIRSDANPSRAWRTRGAIAPSARATTFGSLEHDSAYNFIIQACNADGCSPDSPSLHVPTAPSDVPPAAPSNLRVCPAPTGPPPAGGPQEFPCFLDALTILWDDNSDNEDAFEVEWRILQSPSGPVTGLWHADSVPADYESYLFPSLLPGDYELRVRACNAVACSAYSNTLAHTAP